MKRALLICLGLIAGFSFKSTQAGSICSQPKKVGFCRAAFPRFYYNSETEKCTRFFYGGCGGNENNFNTMEDCQAKCDICSQPKKPGLCRAAFRRFYFDSETKKCTTFIYGGCLGNKNNFNTLDECQAKCRA